MILNAMDLHLFKIDGALQVLIPVHNFITRVPLYKEKGSSWKIKSNRFYSYHGVVFAWDLDKNFLFYKFSMKTYIMVSLARALVKAFFTLKF